MLSLGQHAIIIPENKLHFGTDGHFYSLGVFSPRATKEQFSILCQITLDL